MSTPALAIRQHLVTLGRRRAAAAVLLATARWLTPAIALILLAGAADHLLALPAAVRAVLLLGVVALVTRLVLGIWRELGPVVAERTALRLEQAAGITDNRLINGCQFALTSQSDNLVVEAPKRGRAEIVFIAQSIAAADVTLRATPLAGFYQVRALQRWCAAAVLVVGLLVIAAVLMPQRTLNAMQRLLLPFADVPPLGAVRLTIDPAADVTLEAGANFVIHVRLAPADGHGLSGRESVTGIVPELYQAPGERSIAADPSAGERTLFSAAADGFALNLPALAHPFVFRVQAGGTWSRCIRVQVLPPPTVTSGRFIVTPPAYVGGKDEERPGPPATLTVLPGSHVRVEATIDRELPAVAWRLGTADIALARDGQKWMGTALIEAAVPYAFLASGRSVATGTVQLANDAPPTCDLPRTERNLLLSPGATLDLDVNASDDHGLATVAIEVRDSGVLKAWRYLGPPGPVSSREHLSLTLDAQRFPPGRTYVIEAVASDARPPSGQRTRSAPLVVRLRTLGELALPQGDPRGQAFAALKEALVAELQARGVTATITANLADIRTHGTLAAQVAAQRTAQHAVGDKLVLARDRFASASDERTSLIVLGMFTDAHTLESGDLTQVEQDTSRLPAIAQVQDELIARMTRLLGELADQARAASQPKPADQSTEGQRRRLEQLKEDLAAFAAAQERILERSKTLAERGPADLSDGERKTIGELAAEEKAWSKFLESKVSDLSKQPPQDFSDGRMAIETNAVFQEVKLAADALTRSAMELAVPREQSGLELAKSMEHNIEKWLMNAPDKTKWSMEDATKPADVPLAELPAEMEDLVGDLLDKEEAMTDEVEDVTSAWMDSIDKGAGWDAGDGPISNMSAKGVTGNTLPNQSEIGGRSGEGRTGRSNGQFVQDEAVGKGGRDTPTRLTPTPFEAGSVKDSSKEQPGGATGGGKTAGTSAEGLVGPTPPPKVAGPLARLTGAQAQLRQQAGVIALKLRERRLPSGDLENAVQAMADLEHAAQVGNVTALRQRHTDVVDALTDARRAVAAGGQLQQERSVLPEKLRSGLQQGTPENVPAGYEDLVGRYFQALSGAQP